VYGVYSVHIVHIVDIIWILEQPKSGHEAYMPYTSNHNQVDT